jgi:uncharacterized protein (DUF2267 family)
MTQSTFIDKVAEQAGVSADLAARLTQATLRTFAERITAGEAEDLAARMPDGLGSYLRGGGEKPANYSFDDFMRLISERAVDRETAERAACAVLQAMHKAVGDQEFEDAMSQLPKYLQQLAQSGPGGR